MRFFNLRTLLREFVCDIIIFLYKIGEALLDATIRPYIITAVCNDFYDNYNDDHDFSKNDSPFSHHLHGNHMVYVKSSYNDTASVCWKLDQLPEVSGVTDCLR